MDMRTPLGKVRGLGSAKDGTEHFWRPAHVTAVANVPLIRVLHRLRDDRYAGAPYEEVVAALCQSVRGRHHGSGDLRPGIIHMRLGMQVIIEDYVHR